MPEYNDPLAFNRRFCIAPMIDCTDRHARYFLRRFSPHMLLYTEMITAAAILNGDRDYLLGYDQSEHPLALQLGGSDLDELAIAAAIGEDYGYDEINLNVGCPSDRVQSGTFGACLMATPKKVAECVTAIKAAVKIPVTVKHRTGIDHLDSFELLQQFVAAQVQVGVDALIIHARKAWLQGLSPKQNRQVPPLEYDKVYRINSMYPQLPIVINGGISSLEQCRQHLQHCDGVMLGREPYANPYMLSEIDASVFDVSSDMADRKSLLRSCYPYFEAQLQKSTPLHHMTRHVLGLFHGQPNGKHFRRIISENACRKGADLSVLEQALEQVA